MDLPLRPEKGLSSQGLEAKIESELNHRSSSTIQQTDGRRPEPLDDDEELALTAAAVIGRSKARSIFDFPAENPEVVDWVADGAVRYALLSSSTRQTGLTRMLSERSGPGLPAEDSTTLLTLSKQLARIQSSIARRVS